MQIFALSEILLKNRNIEGFHILLDGETCTLWDIVHENIECYRNDSWAVGLRIENKNNVVNFSVADILAAKTQNGHEFQVLEDGDANASHSIKLVLQIPITDERLQS